MAIAQQAIFEVRSATGSDSNGGFFVEGASGTDYSQQAAAQATGTVTSASTTVTATTGIFTSAMVGNGITDGTTWKQITAFTSSTVVTVDSAPSWTSASISVGGALATYSKAASIATANGQTIFCKGEEDRSTVIPTNTTGTRICGYSTTRLDDGKFIIKATAGMGTMFPSTSDTLLQNMKFDGNAQTISAALFANTNFSFCRNIEVTGVAGTNTVCTMPTGRQIWVHDNTSSGAAMAVANIYTNVEEVEINGNTNASAGFSIVVNSATITVHSALIYNNGGDGVKFGNQNSAVMLTDVVIYGQGGNGVNNAAAVGAFPGIEMERCIIMNCTGKAISMANNATQKCKIRIKNVFEYNNGSSSSGNYEGTLTLLNGDPFVSASTGNFALNPSGPDYAMLKAVGFTYPRGTTVDYGAAGAAQPQASGGGGFVSPGLKMGGVL